MTDPAQWMTIDAHSLSQLWSAHSDAHSLPLYARSEWLLALSHYLDLKQFPVLAYGPSTEREYLPLRFVAPFWRTFRDPHAPFGAWLSRTSDPNPLVQALAKQWRGPMYLAGLPGTPEPAPTSVVHRPAEGFHSIAPGSIPGNLRRNLNRIRRKATAEIGAVQQRVVTQYQGHEADFDTFIELESSAWKGQTGSALSLDSKAAEFYRELAIRFSNQGLRLEILYFGDTAVSTQFCLVTGGYQWVLKIGYKHALKAYAPGALLLQESVNQLPPEHTLHLNGVLDWGERWHPKWSATHHIFAGATPLLGPAFTWLVKQRWTK